MSTRPQRAMANPAFYTASASRCRRWVEELSPAPAGATAERVAGIVPHAGWAYSGRVAGKVWRALSAAKPEASPTVIIFGAVHYAGIPTATAYPEGAWETPLGPLEVDAELAARLERELAPRLRLGARAHEREHSIEVQLPFIKALFPEGTRILPIAAPPDAAGAELGAAIAELTRGAAAIAAGSTDLTHYGERFSLIPAGSGPKAEAWMRENDRRMIELLLSLEADAVEAEAEAHHNACGPGAAAATLAFARVRGAQRGELLEHCSSHEVQPEGEFETAVGYAGIVY